MFSYDFWVSYSKNFFLELVTFLEYFFTKSEKIMQKETLKNNISHWKCKNNEKKGEREKYFLFNKVNKKILVLSLEVTKQ